VPCDFIVANIVNGALWFHRRKHRQRCLVISSSQTSSTVLCDFVVTNIINGALWTDGQRQRSIGLGHSTTTGPWDQVSDDGALWLLVWIHRQRSIGTSHRQHEFRLIIGLELTWDYNCHSRSIYLAQIKPTLTKIPIPKYFRCWGIHANSIYSNIILGIREECMLL